MKKETVERLLLVLLLVSLGVALRWMLYSYPNVAPTAALAMFAGYKLSSVRWALMVPIWITTLSDLVIGGYAWPVMLTVYAALSLPVFLGIAVRRFQPKSGSWLAKLTRGVMLGGASVVGSVLFFLISNFAVWAASATGLGLPMYEATLVGLGECYAAALPFFRYTLTGDLVFNGAIFGAYALGCLLIAAPQKETAAAVSAE
ncbi:hypothetical protein LOC68_03905 [Blastopirellula sp. JC732]|uniref:Uncharacterized protein n=1 Tax=Blastopirellula sediminis TaxID=2894196 RepID=A0A9X1MJK8_9BACT|nr:DUF6580 family putative transport protein [Blastopirellula sediminis]MCC9609697.1 hypothetical protein [Blastopirellula sediminis]MCC9627527.1 hypothetical protein [Blastopirellula sediminis]